MLMALVKARKGEEVGRNTFPGRSCISYPRAQLYDEPGQALIHLWTGLSLWKSFSLQSQLSYSVQVLANYFRAFHIKHYEQFPPGPIYVSICLSERISSKASECFTAYIAAAVSLSLVGFLCCSSIFSGTL